MGRTLTKARKLDFLQAEYCEGLFNTKKGLEFGLIRCMRLPETENYGLREESNLGLPVKGRVTYYTEEPPNGVSTPAYITAKCYILGQWLPKTAAFDAVFGPRCTA
jgi:hypothetical protein